MAFNSMPETTRRVQSVLNSLHQPVVILDEGYSVLQANQAFYDTFCTTPEGTIGTSFFELMKGPWNHPELQDRLQAASKEGRTFESLEIDCVFPELGRRALRLNGRRLQGGEHDSPRVLIAIDDVTTKRNLQHELRRVEKEYQTLFENAQDAVFLVAVQRPSSSPRSPSPTENQPTENHKTTDDLRFEFIRLNATHEALTGLSTEKARGKTPRDFFPGEAGRQIEANYRRCVEQKKTLTYDEELAFPAGTTTWYTKLTPVLQDGEVSHIVGISREVTERRRLERTVVAISDEVRRRIGQDLHDMIASELTGTAFLARSLANQLGEDSTYSAMASATEKAQEVAHLINSATEKVRQLSQSLMPLEVPEQDLPTALEHLAARRTRVAPPECEVQIDASLPPIHQDVASALYRIANEAVTNAIQHAEAGSIRIRLTADDDHLQLVVCDDGRGIPNNVDATKGVGLRLMQYNSNLIGATFTVGAREKGGTEVRCCLPTYKAQQQSAGH